ncbi:hypothetical protein ABW20_dc0106408 [Dactylellina cionopaga]|nr:hypothetical protein ABW20_dc0106408 [Dactylellina cionopaga]
MPPRKSDTSKVAAAAPAEDPASPEEQSSDEKPKGKSRGTNVDDNTLPKTIVTRLAKGNVPSNTQIQKDAVTAFTRSSTVFINYLASAANDITVRNGKKTIMPKDVLEALDFIEFSALKERLAAELEVFNDKQAAKRSKAKSRGSLAGNTTVDTTADPMSEDDSARPLKRQRKSLANEGRDDDDEGGGAATESNILEDGSQDDEEEAEEGEEAEAEEGEESGEESGESGESGDGEPEDGMEDRVEDIDRDDEMGDDDDDEALDDFSD